MIKNNTFKITAAEMAQFIDHTLLKPEATPAPFDKLCEEAISYGFKAVCVNSGWVAYVVNKLKETEIAVCSVIGFPLGQCTVWARLLKPAKRLKTEPGNWIWCLTSVL